MPSFAEGKAEDKGEFNQKRASGRVAEREKGEENDLSENMFFKLFFVPFSLSFAIKCNLTRYIIIFPFFLSSLADNNEAQKKKEREARNGTFIIKYSDSKRKSVIMLSFHCFFFSPLACLFHSLPAFSIPQSLARNCNCNYSLRAFNTIS